MCIRDRALGLPFHSHKCDAQEGAWPGVLSPLAPRRLPGGAPLSSQLASIRPQGQRSLSQ
eukprot:3376146-Prymnesium_polylepis.1